MTVLHGSGEPSIQDIPLSKPSSVKRRATGKADCAYCQSQEHYFSQCSEVAQLSLKQLKEWIGFNKQCWRCVQNHQAAHCTLKKPGSICQEKHLLVLNEVNLRPNRSTKEVVNREESCLTSSASNSLYLDQPRGSNRVLLKVVPVLLRYRGHSFSTFALLDDGSERSMHAVISGNKVHPIRSSPTDSPTGHPGAPWSEGVLPSFPSGKSKG